MVTGILKETGQDKRVAMLPVEVSVLIKMGTEVLVEKGAGESAFASDNEYALSGASVKTRQEVIAGSDILLSVNLPVTDLPEVFIENQILISVLNPSENADWIEKARLKGITLLGLDLIPRTTRAQSMDVLSSMATVAGYKAVLDAASLLPRFFPMFMSASGTIKPARLLILGAGVAGLQALAIARKLGAVVEVFDVRSAVKEEVKSLGGRFIEVVGAKEDASAGGYAVEQSEDFRKKQLQLIQTHAASSDVIICTAQIPGKKAPVLVQAETVRIMKPGSVIVDLAATTGGNCELTQEGENRMINGVHVVGKTNYPSDMPTDASRMFGCNLINLLRLIIDQKGGFFLDMNDEIIKGTTAVHAKEYASPRLKQILNIK